MKAITFLISLLLISVEALTQELDEIAAEDADFFARGKYYQSIYPIIQQRHEWMEWETDSDSAQKAKKVSQVRGESKINLIYVTGTDENGIEEGDTLSYSSHNLHFLDYNGDGLEDFIFEQQVSSYRGHVVKFYKGDGNYYHFEYRFVGMVVALGRSEENSALWFTLYDYPCCDGYIHSLESFYPVLTDDSVNYRLAKVEKYIESNTVNKRRKNLPTSFLQNKRFKTDSEAVVLYHDMRSIHQKFLPTSEYNKKYKTYHPFGMIPAHSTGMVLNQIYPEASGEKDTLFFVKFKAKFSQSKAIRYLERESKNTHINQIEAIDTTTYYGWLNKMDVKLLD